MPLSNIIIIIDNIDYVLLVKQRHGSKTWSQNIPLDLKDVWYMTLANHLTLSYFFPHWQAFFVIYRS